MNEYIYAFSRPDFPNKNYDIFTKECLDEALALYDYGFISMNTIIAMASGTPIPVTIKYNLPNCSVCGKDLSVNWDTGKYECFSCNSDDNTDIEPSKKVPCDCDMFSVIMVTGCKNPNHY